ncbi:L-ascorbate metabolism protein UlaG, beta-lactamase superfamily [Aquimarina spongiae]|uniref:L-ascorbate metabolism protein UlaG, beta-lactamase superfamily n=2 Tax=Aquimarina spongiae TaxID=570521 RepID=A0A1M6CMT9_9FLAO|nr:L-ascorbate metabolism protein UlaG, beta-lactamase superfamily [Aquimarina spongiae]
MCSLGISQDKITITYIGNMGVHLAGKDISVLIDGLHTKYGEDYLYPNAELIKKIHTHYTPNAILFTHHHGDHFSPVLASNYLKSNSKAMVFGAQQITDSLKTFKDQSFTIKTSDYIKQTINVGALKITGMKVDHAGKRHRSIQNVGYIVELDHQKILHLGDTSWLEEIKLFNQLQLVQERIDIAILPYWMLLEEDASTLLKKHINPKYTIATHISPRIKEKELSSLKEKYPNIYFLTHLEQQIHL